MTEEDLSDEEKLELQRMIGDYPKEEEKQNVFTFFKKVIEMDNNSKTANLNEDEIGLPILPVRSSLELSHFCNAMGMKGFGDYFLGEAQITLATSLSRDGFLDKLAVTQKRELDRTQKRKIMKENKGWFRKKEKNTEEEF